MELHGKYGSATVFTENIEGDAIAQIGQLLDQPFAAGRKIRIMPDVHAGVGCVIGFTANLGDMVVPNLVGVDIGCGMLTVKLGDFPPDFPALDSLIRDRIPAGMRVRERAAADFPALEELACGRSLKDRDRLLRSLGTLGGGNHFIEVDRGKDGYYLVIHTGSRNLGKQVAEYYQKLAVSLLHGKARRRAESEALIRTYREQGRERELEEALSSLGKQAVQDGIPDSLCYLTGQAREEYLRDMAIAQNFAARNRALIAETVLGELFGRSLQDMVSFETVHNYIDLQSGLVRKGAVSAKRGERLLIPVNMRDGSLLCVGKGNPEWNCSAPHGAGRALSRSAARRRFTVEEFRDDMAGIWSTSVGENTLDECPRAYKHLEDLLPYLEQTAAIEEILRPVYNFKAGE